MNLTPMIETLSRALDRSAADPVRIDRLTLSTLRDTLVDLDRALVEPPVRLTPTELAIYRQLQMANGGPVPHVDLVKAAHCGTRAVLWVHVCRMREKLADAGEIVDSVRGHGYMLRREAP